MLTAVKSLIDIDLDFSEVFFVVLQSTVSSDEYEAVIVKETVSDDEDEK
jgi:hypothetical protein